MKLKRIKRLRMGISTFAIISIIAGLFLIFFPIRSLTLMCFIVGAISLLVGVLNIIGYFSKYDLEKFFRVGLAGGIIFTIIGFFLIFRSNLATNILVIVIGILVFMNSIIKLPGAFDMKHAGVKYWWISALLSVITAIIGLVMFCTPFDFKEFIIVFVGISFVIDGISNLFTSLYVSKKVKIYEDNKSLKDRMIDAEFEEKNNKQ